MATPTWLRYRSGNECANNGSSTCTPIKDTAGNPVRNGQVFMPGTVRYNSQGEVITGTPFANNQVPSSYFSSQYRAMINNILPGYRGNLNAPVYSNGSGDQLQIPFQDTYVFYKNQYAARIDLNFGPKANAFFRYVDDRQQESKGFGIFSGPSFSVYPQFRQKPGKSYAWSLVNVISPTLTNEVTVGWLHLNQLVDIVPGTDKKTYDKTAIGYTFADIYPSTNTHHLAPQLNSGDGYVSTGLFPAGWTSTGNTVMATDDVTKVAGNHVIKFGLFGDLNENGQEGTWQENPSFNFGASNQNSNDSNSGIANMLTGNYTTVSQSNIFAFGHFHFIQLEGYLQDTWKATPRLTLDYGLRYEYIGPTYTTGEYHQYYFVPTAYTAANAVTINTASNIPAQAPTQGSIITGSGNPYNGMVQEGTNNLPKGGLYNRYNNFGPRIGFAYDVFGTGKSALRGGFGTFYERYQQNIFNFGAISNPPTVYTPTVYVGKIDNVSDSIVNGQPLTTSSLNAQDINGKIPTTYGFNLGIQQALPYNVALDITYIGNVSRHQVYVQQLEQLPLGYTTSTNALATVNNVTQALFPYEGYNSINYTRLVPAATTTGCRSIWFAASATSSRLTRITPTQRRSTWMTWIPTSTSLPTTDSFPASMPRLATIAGTSSTHSGCITCLTSKDRTSCCSSQRVVGSTPVRPSSGVVLPASRGTWVAAAISPPVATWATAALVTFVLIILVDRSSRATRTTLLRAPRPCGLTRASSLSRQTAVSATLEGTPSTVPMSTAGTCH